LPDDPSRDAIVGTVTDEVTGAAVAGATVKVQGAGVEATSDTGGSFSTSKIDFSSLPKDSPPPGTVRDEMIPDLGRVTVTIEAAGYGGWTGVNLPVYRGDYPIIHASLSADPETKDWTCRPRILATSRADCEAASAPPKVPAQSQASARGDVTILSSCNGYYSNATPPSNIIIYHNNPYANPPPDYQIHNRNFKTYVKEVLANEIPSAWKIEALQANAMAVRNFAWWWVNNGPGGSVGGQCYDVDSSTNFQAWDDEIVFSRQSEAVDSIWHAGRMTRGNIVDQSNYKSGSSSDDCGEFNGGSPPGYDMSQYGTQACALDGMQWPGIIRQYYFYSSGDPTHVVLLDDYPNATEHQVPFFGWWVRLYALNRSGSVWQKSYKQLDDTWSGWDTNLGGTCSSAPAAADIDSSHLWVFCRKWDTSGLIQTRRWDGNSWWAWSTLTPSGGFQSGPGATEYNQPSVGWTMRVYALGWDKNIYENFLRLDTGFWNGWNSIGSPSGGCTSAPAADARTANELYVFCRATDGSFRYRMWNGGAWGSWTSIGNTNQWVSSPGATDSLIGGSQIRAYGDGTLGRVWEKYNSGSGWSSWADLGGGCQSAANATDLPSTTYLYVFCHWDPEYFGVYNRFYYKWFGIGWSDWINLGEPP
jgi:hypothetical protein